MDKAREYRTKFPKMPTRTLSRVMYNENAEVFKDLEAARWSLRNVEGKTGAKKRKTIKDKTLFMDGNRPMNPFKLPESFQEERIPFRLPKSCDNILMISDLHVPYHDIPAMTAALNFGKKQKVNTIFINGDVIDFHRISRFQADPTKRSVWQELEDTRQVLGIIRKAFPKADIYWLKGNHDVRLEHYLTAKAPELLGVEEFELKHLLKLPELKINILDDKTHVKIGKLSVTHGHLVIKGIFAPVNAARGVYMRTKQSTIIGHCHKVSEHSETNMDGDLVTTYSMGCLCELNPDYNPLVANCAHGFAHIKVRPNGNYNVRNYRIYKGEVL